jgi:hypothetical protein
MCLEPQVLKDLAEAAASRGGLREGCPGVLIRTGAAACEAARLV